MSIRHYFAGGNTPQGFYSYYDEILPMDAAQKIIYIKGGPGTGKSTFMKNLGATWADQGHEVEFLHCSGDPGSLDGVVCRKKGWAVLDGTAPHAQDPKLLGAVDTIFDPGQFVDTTMVQPYKERLWELTTAKKACYARAYRYLSMAGILFSGIVEQQTKVLPQNALVQVSESLFKRLLSDQPIASTTGRLRHAFANAITPMGVMGYFETLFWGYKTICIRTENGVGADFILRRIAEGALARGISVQAYCSPIFPKQLEHLVLEELEVAITTAKNGSFDEEVFLSVEQNNRALLGELKLFDLLIERTVDALRAAKEEHARLEEILTPSVDFGRMQDEFSRMLTRLCLS